MLTAFAMGALTGAVLATLFAPKAGREVAKISISESANSAIAWDGRIGGPETTKRRRIDGVVSARRSAPHAAGSRRPKS
jgi:gas vesicle protein